MQGGKGTKEADIAIREASTGKIPINEMLIKIIAAQVFVPLSAPPEMDGDSMKSWQPATVSHPSRGDYLVAFTNPESQTAFIQNNPNYGYGLMVESQFLITVLPPEHGILFNLGGETCFEWDRQGIAAYQQTIALKKK